MKGMTMKTGWRAMLIAGSALMLAGGLSACSSPEPEAPPIDNSAFDETAAPPEATEVETNYESAPVTENLSAVAPVEELPPPPPIAHDQQVLDDASATGMTSRSTRNDPAAEDAPVDDTMANQQWE
jgi:hypothetical protein